MTWHNLCTTLKPPTKLRFLLGLGLNYCVQPWHSSTTRDLEESASRFRRDINLRLFFAGSTSDWDPKQLFIKSNWEPNPDDIPIEFRSRVSYFLKCVKSAYCYKRGPSNLLPYQQYLLYLLRHSLEFIVLPTDKNLGPALLERVEYIRRVFDDHLSDDTTYLQLTKPAAALAISRLYSTIQEFLETYSSSSLSDRDAKFIQRSLDVEEPLCEFYILAKIHKDPWATRPIISQSGSLLHGLGRWVDQQLQPISSALSTYIKSSLELKSKVLLLTLPPGTRLFTFDASSMYTNIDTDHAIETISSYLTALQVPNHLAIIAALDIVMRNCYFRFGDTYWHQVQGTAMGTPPAPSYATLYYGIHETLTLLPRFQPRLGFYYRYIDDGVGAWIPHPDPDQDDSLWTDFREALPYGQLTWTVTPRQLSIPFLDLRLTILPSGRVKTSLYEKERNLYLYLPPHSAHPPGLLRGLIIGMIFRILNLTTDLADAHKNITDLYRRLRNRGYDRATLVPLFNQAYARVSKRLNSPLPEDAAPRTLEDTIFFHIPYNSHDPPRRHLQQLFRSVLHSPPNEPALPTLENFTGSACRIDRLIVAYHRQRNLKNLLFPRRFRQIPHQPASSFYPPPPFEAPTILDDFDDDSTSGRSTLASIAEHTRD
jgi:hypothetical protein